MAYDYNRIKNAYLSLGYEDQKKYAEQYKNDANFQQFYKDYTAEQKNKNVYNADTTKKMTTATNGNVATNSYWDSWGAANATKYSWYWVSSAWDYTYNPNLTTGSFNSDALKFWNNAISYGANNPWYLEQRNNYLANALYNEWKTDEKSIRNYLNTFQDYRDYDVTGQNNTVQAILNRMGKIKSQAWSWNNQWQDLNSQLTSEIWNNYENYKNGYSDLMWGSSNYAKTFDEAVANKLKEAYWLTPEEFEERYPEQYKQTMEYLETVRNVWDNTDPSQRQMLDGRLQGIIGSWVWAWSDISKLNRLEESVLNKFKNPDKVKEDMQNIVKLQTEWKTTREIAKEMWISEDQVQQAILAYNWLDNKLWDYYQLTDVAAKDITEPYDTKLQRLEEEKKIALERANRNVQWLKEDFDTNIERQKQQNDINAHNADAIAWRTGLGFSKRGIEWINYVNTQAQQIIDDLTRNYDRNSQQLADGIADIIRNWQWNSEDLTKASEEALTKAKNVYTSNMLAIQQQYWTVWLQAQQALSENVQNFIAEAENIYDNMLNRQQQNLSNLITNVSNLNALQMNNLALRNQQIQQFQAESLNMNRSQLQNLANQLWMWSQDFETLLNYQTQAVQNQLNWYLPGSWILFQDDISSMLESWANGQEVLQRVMNQPEFKAMQQQWNDGTWSSAGNGYIFNNATWESKQIYWDLTTWAWNSDLWITWGNNYVSSVNIWWETYAVSQETYQWLQDFMSNHAVWSNWWQCGKFVNDYLQSLWLQRVFTDPIDKKKAAINTPEWYTPQVWDIAVMNSPSSPQYWHVAIITWVEQWENGQLKLTTLESNKKWEWQVFTRTFIPNISTDKQVFWYYHPDGVADTSALNQANWPVTDYWVPISYDRSIKAMIPTQLMNSDTELKKLESNIESLYKANYSAEDAVLQYMWFNVNNPEDKEIAMWLVNAVRSLSNEDNVQSAISYISQRINAWDYNSAIKKVENLVKTEAKKNEWDWYFDESTARWLVQKTNELIELANSLPEDIWLFQWSMQKYLKKLKRSDAAKLQAAISYLTDEQRLKQVWSNVTEHELEMVKNWIPQLDDRTETFMNKLDQLKKNALTNLNAWRTVYWLPVLDENTLLNSNNRTLLYQWFDVWWGRWLTWTINLSNYSGRS